MKTIILISCVAKKENHAVKAEFLYKSSLFQKNLAYAKQLKPDAIYILSAKYGLVALDEVIAPYDVTLNTMGVALRREWATKVLAQLKKVADFENDQFIFLAGNRYREFLIPELNHVEIPLKGLRIGEQMKQLKAWLQVEDESRRS